MADMVVVVPGLMGSVLEKDGQPVWGQSRLGYLAMILHGGAQQQQLVLRNDKPEAGPLDDGVRAVDLLDNYVIVPGFVSTPGYSKLVKAITDMPEVDFQLGVNLHKFPYDWRRTIRHAARELEAKMATWLAAWRARSGDAGAKAIFLAHSMGGLVCRYYLEVLGGWRACRHLITFGTPHRGSLQPLQYVVEGYPLLPNVDLTTLARSCTSSYELMARYPCIKSGDEWLRISDIEVGGRRLTEASLLHKELDEAIERNRALPNYPGYRLLPVIGSAQPTRLTANVAANGKLEFLDTDSRHPNLMGDGTVSEIGALPPEQPAPWYLGTHHTELPVSREATTHVTNMLRIGNFAPDTMLGSSLFTLAIPDAFRVDAPLKGTVSSGQQSSEARLVVSDEGTGQVVAELDLSVDGPTEFEAPVPAAGLYRVRVSSFGNVVAPCAKVVLVVD